MNGSSLSFENIIFPDRKSITRTDTHLDDIIEKAKEIDLQKVNFEGEDFVPQTKIIQRQKVYFWLRVFIKDEIDITPESKVTMIYNNGEESLETFFMYFGKKGFERDINGQIVNFNPEDDKKVLCLLLDSENININNENIPHMKTLFPLSKYFKPQYFRKYDYKFKLDDDRYLDFFDISF